MTKSISVLHLVDDCTPGGVMRVVDFISSNSSDSKGISHEKLFVKRGQIRSTRYDADIVVSHLTISWRSLAALIVMRAANSGKPLIHVEHSYTENFVSHNVKNKKRFCSLLRFGFALFDKIVAVSYAQSKWFIDANFCRSEKVTTIQSCVDLDPFRSLPRRSGPNKVFAAIGRLEPQKGFDVLIQAFRACPEKDISLCIFGEGGEAENLKKLAGADTRISFMGHSNSPSSAFEDADTIIMPSRWEAYGLVAIEALSAGRKLICSNIDGLKDHKSLGADLLAQYSISTLSQKISETSFANEKSNARNKVKVDDLEKVFNQKWQNLIREMHP